MAIAIALVFIVIGSIIFHFWSPWGMTPLASNWGTIDDTMVITLIITGLVFIAINFFVAYAVIKFRHQKGRKAKYEPENKRLEIWLTIATSIGIVAMLAPGLIVYADFVEVPEDAHEIEVVGQQWSWSFRLPGEDGKLGKSAVEFMSLDNPFGVDPLDENGQDDRLVPGNSVSLPVGKPVKVLLRSKDVLHDFYVPQFRVKMDMVPGTVSYLWFTPTVEGEFEILCAEFCGLGHFNMRGIVNVLSAADYDTWRNQQITFAEALAKASAETLSVKAQQGKAIAEKNGCLACHNFVESAAGPTWLGLYGSDKTLNDGTVVTVDDAYLKESILDPGAKVVKGFAPIMPAVQLSDLEIEAVIAYIREKGAMDSSKTVEQLEAVAPQPTGETDKAGAEASKPDGAQLAQTNGCIACHSVDGSPRLGPSWKGLFGSERKLATGQTVIADRAYLRKSIYQPNAELVEGYQPMMPPASLNEKQVQALIDYIESLK